MERPRYWMVWMVVVCVCGGGGGDFGAHQLGMVHHKQSTFHFLRRSLLDIVEHSCQWAQTDPLQVGESRILYKDIHNVPSNGFLILMLYVFGRQLHSHGHTEECTHRWAWIQESIRRTHTEQTSVTNSRVSWNELMLLHEPCHDGSGGSCSW